MAKPSEKNTKSGGEESESVDLRSELDRFEQAIADLRVEYEQYFAGILPLAPEKSHADIKRFVRKLRKAPFKSSALAYRLRMLEGRLNTLNTYWQRVLREREAGTYHKDVFKAQIREQKRVEEERAGTKEGKAERSLQGLFQSYKSALEKQTGKSQELNYDSFEKNLLKRAKDFKEQHPGKKVSFKVVVKDGKVTVQAKAKDPAPPKE